MKVRKMPIGVHIYYVSKSEMDELSKRYKLKHDPAVLSFNEPKEFVYPKNQTKLLGEIYLCRYYIKAEAKKFRATARDHEARLLAHGVLHILGYEHNSVKAAKKMESIEKKILGN